MNIDEILEVLHKGANTPKNDSSEYAKGKRDGLVQAYSHAWTELKNLNIPDVSGSLLEFNDDVDRMMQLYGASRYTQAEELRDDLAERLDDIMRLGGNDR